VIDVADTGIGIAPADRERIFERFYRSALATRRAIPGTGLGLTVAQAIVEAHNGTITVDSEESRGSVFKICLPLRSPAVPVRSPA
jgi:signal transduction histidine kinase